MEGAGCEQVSQGDTTNASSPPEEPPKHESDAPLPETGPAGDTSAQQSLPADTDTTKPSEPSGNTQELPRSSLSQGSGNKSPRQEPTLQETIAEGDTDNTSQNANSKSVRQDPTLRETTQGEWPTTVIASRERVLTCTLASREDTSPKCLRISESDRQRSASLRSQTSCKGTKNGDSKVKNDAEGRNGNPNVRGAGRKTGTISDKTSTGDSTFFSPLKAYCWICLEPCKIVAGTRASRAERCLCCSCYSGAYSEPDLSSPCGCTGSLQYVHRTCLRRWVREQGSHSCRICNEFYHIPPAQSLCQRLSEEGVVGTCCPSLRHHANAVVFVTLLVLFVGVISTLGYSTANTYMELKKQSRQNPEGGASTMIILVFGLSLSLLIVLSVLMCVYVTCVTKIYYRNRRGSYDVPAGEGADGWEELPLEEIIQASELEYQELQAFWDSLPPEVREIAATEGFVLPPATPRDEEGTPPGVSDGNTTPRVEEGTPSGEAQQEEMAPPGESDGNPDPQEVAPPPPTGSSDTQESSGTQRMETVTVEI